MPELDNLREFAGLRVAEFTAESTPDDLPQGGSPAWAVRLGSWDDEADFGEVFARFLDWVDTGQVTALVIGYWGMCHEVNSSVPRDLLIEAAGRFPGLRALFFGDIAPEESEISWIEHCDLTGLLEAYPLLEQVEIRGGSGLELAPPRSEHLRVLRLESGGLPSSVVRAVAAGDLPNLERLDLWLGVEEYGGDATVADLAPLLGGERLPALRHLGLEDSEIVDEIAVAVAAAPVVARLETLSLALGVLTDEGAEALLSGQPLTHLQRLDLHHHFLTDAMVERVRKALPGVEVDLSEQELPDEDDGDVWRYVAVAE
ncbi:STM4015 family protein [Actinomadura scrupuli]|uniref:STM4015 family protein n=1 Tax=Actinomadura scrupuli TaxID=559629 RepID=UPI003D96D1E4